MRFLGRGGGGRIVGGRSSSDPPRIFLSYRRADTGDLIALLADQLREDLGSRNVFRDKDDLIAGTRWQDALDDGIDGCDTALFLVGADWIGARTDGTRRIDDADDPVRVEVERALASNATCTPIPVVVDVQEVPGKLPPSINGLFSQHAVTSTAASLLQGGRSDYQAILVGIWESIRRRTPNGVLVVGDDAASAQLDELVAEMKRAKLIDAQHLSRLAAGACVVSARRIRRGARKWPEAIVATDTQEPSPVLAARILALDEHPDIRRVACIGSGVATGFAIGQVLGGVSGTTSWTAATQVAPAVPAIGTGPLGAISSTMAHAGDAARVGAAAVALGAATTAVVVALPSGAAASARYGYLDVSVDGAVAASEVPESLVDDTVDRWATTGITVDNLLQLDERDVPASLFWLDTDKGRVAGELEDGSGDFTVPANGSADATIWWPMPKGVTEWTIELREEGAEPLRLADATSRPAEVTIPVEGGYEARCSGMQFAEAGVASYNVSPTPEGETTEAPGVSRLGRAAQGSVVFTVNVTAMEDCGDVGWRDVYGDVYNHLTAARIGDLVPDVGFDVPRQNSTTETGPLYVEVPEGETGALTFDWEDEDVDGGVRIELGPIADIAILDN